MNPSLELRVQSMLRAMTEVVIPALDAREALAQEQARLVVGHLHALSLQQRHASRCERLETLAMQRLAQDLLGHAAGGPRSLAAASSLRESLASPEAAGLEAAIDLLIAASGEDGSPAFREAVTRLTLAHAKSASVRARSWFAAMGFGADPGTIPTIEAMLDEAERELERKP